MRAAFLDMDGVIVDSECVRLMYLARFLEQRGISATKCELQWTVGVNDSNIAAKLVQQHALPVTTEALFLEMKQFFGSLYLDAPQLQIFDGLKEFLEALRQGGIKTGVVSSSNCFDVLSVLNRFALLPLFDLVVASEFVKEHKPSPEPYLRAATFAGISPKDCVVVEDSPPGIQAAVAAGMRAIGFTGASVQQDVGLAPETASSYAQLTALLLG